MRIFDLHCDTLFKFFENRDYSFQLNDGHIFEDALVKGGYAAQCFAIYQPTEIKGEDGFLFFKNQVGNFEGLVKNSSVLEFAKTKTDFENNLNNGKISAVLTVENADFLQGQISRIDLLESKGVKVLGLVHNGENCLGFPHSVAEKPLKNFGKEVVKRLNSTDILVDVSHLSEGGFWDVARLSKNPIVATHSGCRSVFEHSRNLSDDQIKAVADSGGVVGCVFYSHFLNGTNRTEIDDIIRHVEHLISVGGQGVVALGTDFDGMECDLFLKDASEMQSIVDALIKKFGFSVAEKICFGNAKRVLWC